MKYLITAKPAIKANYTEPEGWVETDATREILEAISKPKDKYNFMATVALFARRGWSRHRIEAHYSTCRKEDIRGYSQPSAQRSEPETRPQQSDDQRQARARLPVWQGPGSGPSNPPWSSMLHPISCPPQISTYVFIGVSPPSSTANQNPYGPISNSNYGRSEPYHSPYGSSSNAYPSYQASATPSNTYSGDDVKPYRDGLVHPSWIDRHGGASGGSDQGRHGSGGGYR